MSFSIVSWSTFFVYGRWYRRSPAHNRLSHILGKNVVPDTPNGFLVKYEDATMIDHTGLCVSAQYTPFSPSPPKDTPTHTHSKMSCMFGHTHFVDRVRDRQSSVGCSWKLTYHSWWLKQARVQVITEASSSRARFPTNSRLSLSWHILLNPKFSSKKSSTWTQSL